MVSHFIGRSYELAAFYHNKPFDATSLSCEFIFARFAWAVIKRARAIFEDKPLAQKKIFRLKVTDAAPLDEAEEEAIESDNRGGGESELIKPQQRYGVISKEGKQRGKTRKRPDERSFRTS